ncbi:hypothetical protein [Parablautia muri]|uniref:hypothetical protein n=1 Tax=Parablautia muri TaxID=2320879 RepID=UPI00241234B7|nr:hypothetical protein [Parablautia muri]
MWKIIEKEVFSWSLGILADDEKISRAHQTGINLANAAKDIQNAQYIGDEEICSHCHCREFYFAKNKEVICCQCGIIGKIVLDGDEYHFEFPEEQLKHAHDTLDEKFIHANDIDTNNRKAGALRMSEKYKNRVAAYKSFITGSKPQ